MIDKELISSLRRDVSLENGKINVDIEGAQGFEYAFYLHYGKDLEQEFYKDRLSFNFKTIINVNSFFSVSVFYKEESTGEILRISDKYYLNEKVYKFGAENLFEDEYSKIDYYDIGGKSTFIVFNGGGAVKNTAPFGLNFIVEQGFNVISCSHENNLYQNLSFEVFEHVVKPHILDKSVFLYGSSLGAYAALYYSGAVDGTVIAAAPRNSIHPLLKSSKDKSEKSKVNFTHKSFNDIKLTTKEIYVFLDKFQLPDVYFYNEAISKFYKKINLIYVDYAGHELLFHLNKTKQLKKIILNIMDGQLPIIYDKQSQYTDLGRIKIDYQLEKFDAVVRNAEFFLTEPSYDEKLKKQASTLLERAKNQLT